MRNPYLSRSLALPGLIAVIGVTLGLAAVVQAGDLNPPPGPIQPTMRTLKEIEPRRPITVMFSEPDAVWVISQPGTYYLTDHVVGQVGKHGIKIAAEHVTLDLNGFILYGIPGSLSGISVLPNLDAPHPGTRYNVRVYNGVVQQWGQHGVDLSAIVGGSIENIMATDNGGDGIRPGVSMVVRNSYARGNQIGINAIHGPNQILDCDATENRGSGIRAYVGAVIQNCNTRLNGGYGIEGNFGCVVKHCTSSNNAESGIYLFNGGLAADNVCNANAFAGIYVQFSSLIRGNTTTFSTGGVGIFVADRRNRIEGNQVAGNQRGIEVLGVNNILIGNTVTSSTGNDYTIGLGNTFGPIVNAVGVGDLTGVAGASHPWANFRY